MNGLHELSNIFDLHLLCLTNAVECHFDVKLARYLGVGSLGVLMMRQDISGLAFKGLIKHRHVP